MGRTARPAIHRTKRGQEQQPGNRSGREAGAAGAASSRMSRSLR